MPAKAGLRQSKLPRLEPRSLRIELTLGRVRPTLGSTWATGETHRATREMPCGGDVRARRNMITITMPGFRQSGADGGLNSTRARIRCFELTGFTAAAIRPGGARVRLRNSAS